MCHSQRCLGVRMHSAEVSKKNNNNVIISDETYWKLLHQCHQLHIKPSFSSYNSAKAQRDKWNGMKTWPPSNLIWLGSIVCIEGSWVTEHLWMKVSVRGSFLQRLWGGLEALVGLVVYTWLITWKDETVLCGVRQSVLKVKLWCLAALLFVCRGRFRVSVLIKRAANSPRTCLTGHFRLGWIWCLSSWFFSGSDVQANFPEVTLWFCLSLYSLGENLILVNTHVTLWMTMFDWLFLPFT